MSEDSRAKIEPLLALAAPERRRFLKHLLMGSSALAFLAIPASSVLAQGGDGRGKGKGKGDGKGKGKGDGKGKGKGDGGGRGRGEGGRGRGRGDGRGRG